MRNPFVFIRNIRFLKKVIENPSNFVQNRDQKDRWLSNTFTIKNNLSGIEKKYLLEALKAVRKEYPYIPVDPEDYREARELYEQYFEMDNHIESIDEVKSKIDQGKVYVTKFRQEAPVKGKKDNEYYVNSSGNKTPTTYELKKYKKDYNYFSLKGDPYAEGLSEDFLTQFKYSTEEEIEQYLEDTARKEKIQEQIDIKQKEVRELYTKL